MFEIHAVGLHLPWQLLEQDPQPQFAPAGGVEQTERRARVPPQCDERDVVGDGRFQAQALGASIFGEKGQPALDAAAWGRIAAVSILLFLIIEFEKYWLRKRSVNDR